MTLVETEYQLTRKRSIVQIATTTIIVFTTSNTSGACSIVMVVVVVVVAVVVVVVVDVDIALYSQRHGQPDGRRVERCGNELCQTVVSETPRVRHPFSIAAEGVEVQIRRHRPNTCIHPDYTSFTRSSKRQAIVEQTSSKCIRNTHFRRVL